MSIDRYPREGDDESFRVKAPGWIKEAVVGVSKWGPAWALVFVLTWFMWQNQNGEVARGEKREAALTEALTKLSDPMLNMQNALSDHMGTSARTQLFISVMCANNANTAAQRRACFDEYYAMQLKEKEIGR